MKKIILISMLTLALFIVGCSQKVVCNKPYILVGSECCLDKDDNGICDKDEVKEQPKVEVKEEPKAEKEEVNREELKKNAETIALKFARDWEAKDYSKLYDYFIPELKESATREEFVYATDLTEDKIISIRLDSVDIESGDKAYVYYTADYGIGNVKLPAMRMELVNNEWKINAFEKFFRKIEDICGTQCVYDYSIKFEDITKCQFTGYLFIDCVLEFRKKPYFESYVKKTCENLTIKSTYYKCKGIVAGLDNNYTFCKNITEPHNNANCILGYSYIKGERDKCDDIELNMDRHKELGDSLEECYRITHL